MAYLLQELLEANPLLLTVEVRLHNTFFVQMILSLVQELNDLQLGCKLAMRVCFLDGSIE